MRPCDRRIFAALSVADAVTPGTGGATNTGGFGGGGGVEGVVVDVVAESCTPAIGVSPLPFVCGVGVLAVSACAAAAAAVDDDADDAADDGASSVDDVFDVFFLPREPPPPERERLFDVLFSSFFTSFFADCEDADDEDLAGESFSSAFTELLRLRVISQARCCNN
jgi:hypothetical protein